MQVESDLPVGAGLSSSAALEVATARLLMKLYSLEIDPLRLAKICPPRGKRFRRSEVRTCSTRFPRVFGRKRAGGLPRLPFGGDREHPAAARQRVAGVPLRGGAPTGGRRIQRTPRAMFRRRPRARRAGAARRDGRATLENAARGRLDPTVVHRRAAHIVGEDERVFAGIEALRRGDGRGVRRADVRLAREFADELREQHAGTRRAGGHRARRTGGIRLAVDRRRLRRRDDLAGRCTLRVGGDCPCAGRTNTPPAPGTADARILCESADGAEMRNAGY